MRYLPFFVIFVVSAVATKFIVEFLDSHRIICVKAAVIEGHAECVKYEKVEK